MFDLGNPVLVAVSNVCPMSKERTDIFEHMSHRRGPETGRTGESEMQRHPTQWTSYAGLIPGGLLIAYAVIRIFS
jgi:hypothetical protein